MIKNLLYLTLTIVIATCLVIFQETMSNMTWLLSVDMPVTFSVFFGSYFSNLVLMNGGGAVPMVALIAIGMLAAFLIAKILLIWVSLSKPLAYGLAGAAALLAIVLLMPLAFYNLDVLAGGRSILGKIILTLYGFLSGYFFGTTLEKRGHNDQTT
jgi:lysylphosphatidylglycerol synthetase-like protein (DUF2156 family)|tara:strand:+ start:1422 stop:1886 length:465 start_codon:yes stop_codon:yes gene_type:complete